MSIKQRDLLEYLQVERAVQEKSLYVQFGKRVVLDALHAETAARVRLTRGDFVTITPKGKEAIGASA